jgi:microcin C transport system substrate-binding protein
VKEGQPTYRTYYAGVEKVEVLSPARVKFTAKPGDNREIPSILGQMPVLSKAYYAAHPFNQTSYEAPLGSGPYKVLKIDPGKSITLERNPDYWAKDLPVARGRFNFGTIRYDYYRDPTIAVAALKGGAFDWRLENSAKNWATEYDNLPATQQGQLVKETLKASRLTPMQGFIFNLRKPQFADRRVREALGYAFDFEWSNRTLFYGLYSRSRSYFGNTELEAKGLPSPEELKILEPLRGKIPDEVFTKEYQPPKTDGSGNMRAGLAAALKLLAEAGWTVKNNRLVDKNGRPMEFEVLLDEPSFERITLPFVENLKRLGVVAHVRTIDPAQYQHRVDDFDYDMIVNLFPATLSPGNEQREIWGSESAEEKGSYNVVGVKDAAIDQLVSQVIAAPDWDNLVARSRALDRVLQWNYFVVPHFHLQEFWAVYWNVFGHPKIGAKYSVAFDAWWVDKDKAAKISASRGAR